MCDENAIRAEVELNGTALDDSQVDGDVGSYDVGTTTLDWGDGNVATNGTLNVAADAVWAVVFTVTMQ